MAISKKKKIWICVATGMTLLGLWSNDWYKQKEKSVSDSKQEAANKAIMMQQKALMAEIRALKNNPSPSDYQIPVEKEMLDKYGEKWFIFDHKIIK